MTRASLTSLTAPLFAAATLLTLAPALLASDVVFSPAATISATEGAPRDVVTADIDGDGDLDVVVTSFDDDVVVWHENLDGAGGAWAGHTLWSFSNGTGPWALATADLDDDGDADVVCGEWFGGTVHRLENTAGDGSAWARSSIGFSFGGIYTVVTGHVDGDDDVDVVAGDPADAALFWMENLDGSSFALRFIFNEATRSLALADLDDDGDGDLVVGSFRASAVLFVENDAGDGSSWTEHTVGPTTGAALSTVVADFDLDGDLDVAASSREAVFPVPATTARIDWYENDAGDASSWTTHAIVAGGDLHGPLASGDVDGDGDPDLLSGATATDVLRWYDNVGDGSSWTVRTIDLAVSDPSAVIVEDLDGDGDADAVVASLGSDVVGWYENATWGSVGVGVTGVDGVPRLLGTGPLEAAAPTRLALRDMAPASTAWLVIGGALLAPFKGGVLVPAPTIVAPFPTGAGDVDIDFRWVDPSPSGVTLYYQAWIVDGAAVLGFASTNGLAGTTL